MNILITQNPHKTGHQRCLVRVNPEGVLTLRHEEPLTHILIGLILTNTEPHEKHATHLQKLSQGFASPGLTLMPGALTVFPLPLLAPLPDTDIHILIEDPNTFTLTDATGHTESLVVHSVAQDLAHSAKHHGHSLSKLEQDMLSSPGFAIVLGLLFAQAEHTHLTPSCFEAVANPTRVLLRAMEEPYLQDDLGAVIVALQQGFLLSTTTINPSTWIANPCLKTENTLKNLPLNREAFALGQGFGKTVAPISQEDTAFLMKGVFERQMSLWTSHDLLRESDKTEQRQFRRTGKAPHHLDFPALHPNLSRIVQNAITSAHDAVRWTSRTRHLLEGLTKLLPPMPKDPVSTTNMSVRLRIAWAFERNARAGPLHNSRAQDNLPKPPI